MPYDPKVDGGKKAPRAKLDPRLALLLEMDEGRRTALKAHEDAQLERLAAELRHEVEGLQAAPGGGPPLPPGPPGPLKGQPFAPLTAGLLTAERASVRTRLRVPEAHVSAFIVSDASKRDLENLGVQVRSQAGDVFTAFIPLSVIPALEASAAVRYIEVAKPLFPTLDRAAKCAQIDVLRSPPSSASGRGTIVGIIDSTLDIYHHDFRKPSDSSTRVRFLWDQTLIPRQGESGPPAALFNDTPTYGVEYGADQINAQLFAYRPDCAYDLVRHNASGELGSHGTQVAGIAAGNGRSQPASGYIGAAPEADIIFVAQPDLYTSAVLADTAEVVDAFTYIFARAAELGMPCVVNLSQGDNLGPHDGTSVGERYLDGLLEVPGRAITLSAGNSTGTRSHACGKVPPGATKTLTLEATAGATRSDTVEVWYAGEDRFQVTVRVPGAAPITVSPGDDAPDEVLPSGVRITVSSRLAFALNGDNFISIIFNVPPGGQFPVGVTTIELEGTRAENGVFHAWLDKNNRPRVGEPPLRFTSDVDDASMTLGSPGTARRPITVGNHDKNDRPAIAKTSGCGPTRDGRTKPEVAAVGEDVMTPCSSNRTQGLPSAHYAPMNGTSASAPLVAGACACLFQLRGAGLTWANLKQIFEDTAGTTGIRVPDNAFGFGYVQIGSGGTFPLPHVDVWLKDSLTDTGGEPNTEAVAWLSPDIEVLDLGRRAVANPTRNAANGVNNIIRVRVRNRGTDVARNSEVHLHWAEPATHVPFPDAWLTSGIHTETEAGFVNPRNTIVIPVLPAGEFREVEFGWAPPPAGAAAGGGDRFCFLVRLENELDPSRLGRPDRSPIATRNNVALRHVHVEGYIAGGGAGTRFLVVGTAAADTDSLTVMPGLSAGEVVLTLPVQALPWRDAQALQGLGATRAPFDGQMTADGLARIRAEFTAQQTEALTGIRNATRMTLADGSAHVTVHGEGPLQVPDIRLAKGARMTATIHVTAPRTEGVRRFVHVAQRSGGQLVGGVSLELRETEAIT
jgi:hypothetical protein